MTDFAGASSEDWFSQVEEKQENKGSITHCPHCKLPFEAVGGTACEAAAAQSATHTSIHFLQIRERALASMSEGDSYCDPDFPASDRSLGISDEDILGGSEEDEVIAASAQKWVRLLEIQESPPSAPLLPERIDPSSICQGAWPDCFFIAALTSLAPHRESLDKLFISKKVDGFGIYGFQFFRNGKWELVVIDDRIPCNKAGRPLFARAEGVWCMLLEKAYAKLYGSFAAIYGGNTAEALFDLTSAPVFDFSLREGAAGPDEIRAALEEHACPCPKQRRCLITVNSPKDVKGRMHVRLQSGLSAGHAYAITAVAKEGKHLALRVHDPINRRAKKKKATRVKSGVLSAAALERLSSLDSDGRGIWLSHEELPGVFQSLNICPLVPMVWTDCKLSSEWSVPPGEVPGAGSTCADFGTAGGCSSFVTHHLNPHFSLELKEGAKGPASTDNWIRVQVTLTQPDKRKGALKDPGALQGLTYNQIGLMAIRTNLTPHPFLLASKDDYEVEAKTTHWNKRDVSVQLRLQRRHLENPGSSILLIPSCYFPGQVGKFSLIVRSPDAPLVVKPLNYAQKGFHTQRISGVWTTNSSGPDAGVCPHFSLKVAPKDGGVAPKAWVWLCQATPKNTDAAPRAAPRAAGKGGARRARSQSTQREASRPAARSSSAAREGGGGDRMSNTIGEHAIAVSMVDGKGQDLGGGKRVYTNATAVVSAAEFPAGKDELFIVPSTMKARTQGRFAVVVWSDRPILSLQSAKPIQPQGQGAPMEVGGPTATGPVIARGGRGRPPRGRGGRGRAAPAAPLPRGPNGLQQGANGASGMADLFAGLV